MKRYSTSKFGDRRAGIATKWQLSVVQKYAMSAGGGESPSVLLPLRRITITIHDWSANQDEPGLLILCVRHLSILFFSTPKYCKHDLNYGEDD
jgi:hypothetical protein